MGSTTNKKMEEKTIVLSLLVIAACVFFYFIFKTIYYGYKNRTRDGYARAYARYKKKSLEVTIAIIPIFILGIWLLSLIN